MSSHRPEILAPVGNAEMLEAALRAGADAVYLGLQEFNARRNADNFDRESFAEAVRACRVRGVRVYLTLNTLIGDGELQKALDCAAYAYAVGADAVIVQDLGLARLLRDQLPELELHASTQITVHSPAALPVLKRLGFSQVVLSREMSREEIRAFCQAANKLDIRVEVFVHGALCMCMSGQCYLSAVLGGRSGNRGLCAGPCRLPFSAGDSPSYDLSLKDLSLVEHLKELAELGVSSFKIEGRMKRPEYVASATAVCRMTLDGEPCEEWKAALEAVFSRSGFTDGYYTGRRGSKMFGVRQKEDVVRSAGVLSRLHELYRSERQSVPLFATFKLDRANGARLTVSDGEHVRTVSDESGVTVDGPPLSGETVIAKLSRTGNTPFCFTEIRLDLEQGPGLPVSRLNALRREALSAVEEARASLDRRVPALVAPARGEAREVRGERPLIGRFSSLDQVPGEIGGLSAVVLPLEDAWEKYSGQAELLLHLPRGIESEESLLCSLREAKKYGVRAAFAPTLAAAELIQKAGLLPIFDYSMNLYSSAAVKTAEELGAVACVASFEARERQICAMRGGGLLGAIVYGHLPLMLTRNCPIANQKDCRTCAKCSVLTDRRGVRFPVRCRGGYSELYNSTPLWLADRPDALPVDFGILFFTVEDAGDCARILADYRRGACADGAFTRGLYFRGVE